MSRLGDTVFAIRVVAVGCVAVAMSSVALADGFGGISKDELCYLVNPDTVCRVMDPAKGDKAPRCVAGQPQKVLASLAFTGASQSTAASGINVVQHANHVEFVRRDNKTKFARWDSLDPIVRVVASYISANRVSLVAELEVRTGGRVVRRYVGVRLPTLTAAVSPPKATPAFRKIDAETQKRLDPKKAAARKAMKKRSYTKAILLWGEALKIFPDDSESLHGSAVALMKRKRSRDAIARLTRLAKTNQPDAIVYQISARRDKVFQKLLLDADFRKATLLDGAASRVRSAYERAVGWGGKWEQAGVNCDAAHVSLQLKTRPQKMTIVVKDRCRGRVNTSRFRGTWTVAGAASLALELPFGGGKSETLRCNITTCGSEDCMKCGAGTDFEMDFRSVRR